jgi:hypothetical protein
MQNPHLGLEALADPLQVVATMPHPYALVWHQTWLSDLKLLRLVLLIDSSTLGLKWYPDPSSLGSTTLTKLKQTTNREQLCTLIVKREKRKEKCKQSITSCNPTMISLHAPHHVKNGTFAYLFRRHMTIFDHQEVSHAPL